MMMEVGKNKGQPKMRWIDLIRRDTQEMNISLEDALDSQLEEDDSSY